MNKIETGYDLVHRYDGVISPEICDMIYDYITQQKPETKQITDGKMPWDEGDTTGYVQTQGSIRDAIKEHKYKINTIISETFGQITYPHFSDLVLWRAGRKMDWHKDDGYGTFEKPEDNHFAPRKFSCVCYLNDNYTGGETLIRQGDTHYTSVPKKGSIVFFTSDDRCKHKVNQVTEGNRLTLAIWYTTDKQYEEQG